MFYDYFTLLLKIDPVHSKEADGTTMELGCIDRNCEVLQKLL